MVVVHEGHDRDPFDQSDDCHRREPELFAVFDHDVI